MDTNMDKAAFTTLFHKTKGLFQAGLGLKAFKELLKEWEALFEDDDVSFERYKTTVGCLVFESEINSLLEEQLKPDQLMAAIHEKFFRTKDKRCEVGQVLSHIKNKETDIYRAFNKNVQSVGLILKYDKDMFKPSKRSDSFELDSVVCADVFGIESPNAPNGFMPLCPEFYYNGQMVPKTVIFGSGYLFSPNVVVTAAHVIKEAIESIQDSKDLIFIFGLYIYKHYKDGRPNILLAKKDSIYRLNQDNLWENSQTINGDTGDSAWLKVTPLFDEGQRNSTVTTNLDARIPNPVSMSINEPVYALGHGLGVPMKLSFSGTIEHPSKNGWMGCELDIFPGNSGSPVFHANTHELLGIISGPDNLWRPEFSNKNCVSYQINLSGNQSVQTSEIELLIKKMKKHEHHH